MTSSASVDPGVWGKDVQGRHLPATTLRGLTDGGAIFVFLRHFG